MAKGGHYPYKIPLLFVPSLRDSEVDRLERDVRERLKSINGGLFVFRTEEETPTLWINGNVKRGVTAIREALDRIIQEYGQGKPYYAKHIRTYSNLKEEWRNKLGEKE